MPDPNQNNNQQNGPVSGLPFGDTPPLPPDFQNTDQQSTSTPTVPVTPQPAPVAPVATSGQPLSNSSGSAAPGDLPPLVTPPKKKFGGGRIIATILGLFLLVGGIGAGIALTSQQQLFEQKAGSGVSYCGDGICNENASSCSRDCGSNLINCGGVQCQAQYCHCTGGQACTGYECVNQEWVQNVCISQGRSWCSNSEAGGGMTCCAAGYVCNPGGEGCVPGGNPSNPPRSNPPSNPPSSTPQITATCQNIKAYSTSWTVLTQSQLANTPVGGHINFCVTGATTGGSFNKGRFSVNGTALGETTTQRPGSQDYCKEYVIPANTSTFTVVGDIHHVTLGWR